MAQDLEPTPVVQDGTEVTGLQALRQARAAQIATRRRWPEVSEAVAKIAAMRSACDPPTVILRPVRRSA